MQCHSHTKSKFIFWRVLFLTIPGSENQHKIIESDSRKSWAAVQITLRSRRLFCFSLYITTVLTESNDAYSWHFTLRVLIFKCKHYTQLHRLQWKTNIKYPGKVQNRFLPVQSTVHNLLFSATSIWLPEWALYNLKGLFKISHNHDKIQTDGSFIPLNVMHYYHVNVFTGLEATKI